MSRKDLETVEPWRSALREGDPALGAPDLDPQEAARMRRAVVAAAQEEREPRSLPWLSPIWGGAVVAAAALLLVLGFWWRQEPQPEKVAVHDPAPVPPPSPVPPPVEAVEKTFPEPEREAPGAGVPDRPATAVVPPPPTLPPVPVADPPVPEMALAESAEPVPDWAAGIPDEPAVAEGEALPRQVQFATPGGTRVIWMLGPEDDATQEALSGGPEEKTE